MCASVFCFIFLVFHKLSQVVKPRSSTLAEDEFVLVVLSTFYQFLEIFRNYSKVHMVHFLVLLCKLNLGFTF